MEKVAASQGFHRIGQRQFPRMQIFSLEAWFKGQRPELPAPIAITIPKDKSAERAKRVRRPDPSQPEFFFGIEGTDQRAVPEGQVMNPDILPDDAFRADGAA